MPIVSPKKFSAFRENVLCLTQPELAERWDVSKTRISDIETADGSADIRPPNFRRLAELAGMSSEQLLAVVGMGTGAPEADKRIIVMGQVSAAGLVEMFDDSAEVEQVPMSLPDHPKAFALRINGDCMEPEYLNGDVIIVEPIDATKVQPGDDLVVQCDGGADGASTFKRVEKIKDGILHLRPLNTKHKPMQVRCEHVIRAAIEIGLYRPKRRA